MNVISSISIHSLRFCYFHIFDGQQHPIPFSVALHPIPIAVPTFIIERG